MNLSKLIRSVVEAMNDIPDGGNKLPEDLKRKTLKTIIEEDLRAVIAKADPLVKETPEGNRPRRGFTKNAGDVFILYKYPTKRQDPRTQQEKIDALLEAIRTGMQIENRSNAVKVLKGTGDGQSKKRGKTWTSGEVLWFDFIHGLKTPYKGRKEFTGYSYEIQINVAQTTLSVWIKFAF